MPVEIVTIVNSSGKIISNGKQLLGVFKEARACYAQKKASIKAERAVKRSQTFDVAPASQRYHDDIEYAWEQQHQISQDDDAASYASSRRSHSSKFSRAMRKARPALTENNLRTHTEVSSTAPSRPPAAYQAPYAETVQREMTLSRPTLAPLGGRQDQVAMPIYYEDEVLEPYQEPYQEPAPVMPRSRSDPSMHKKAKSIDMDLAYGDLPPDLEFRTDLDPAAQIPVDEEREAQDLAEKVEALLTEAECAHHTATHIIDHLQGNPDAAAAVALTLAELSAVVGKLSPAFLAALKGGSPAVFALLASPQFLIAAGLTVGVTVVMFGGWKIIKRIKDEQAALAARQQPMAFAAAPAPAAAYPAQQQQQQHPRYPDEEDRESAYYPDAAFDEALVLEEELSSIETWRRGISPPGEGEDEKEKGRKEEYADLELISPVADRFMRSQWGDDARTERSGRTHRSSKTAKTKSSGKSHKSHSHSHRRSRSVDSQDERSTRRGSGSTAPPSEAGSHRTSRTEKTERSSRTSKTATTTSSSHKKRELRAIEDGSRDRENTIDLVIRPKKDSLLKTMFRKRKDGDEQRIKLKPIKIV